MRSTPSRASQVGEQRAERMRAVDLGVAVRADHQQVQVAFAAQHVAQHVQRGFGRPVQVVEDEQCRCDLRLRLEPTRDRLEQQVALGLGIA